MRENIKNSVEPYQDSYSPNGIIGEKDACGVGFIANIKGEESNWILQQSLKGLSCMEHRGVMAHSSLTQTTVVHGLFHNDAVKSEFFNNVKNQMRHC